MVYDLNDCDDFSGFEEIMIVYICLISLSWFVPVEERYDTKRQLSFYASILFTDPSRPPSTIQRQLRLLEKSSPCLRRQTTVAT